MLAIKSQYSEIVFPCMALSFSLLTPSLYKNVTNRTDERMHAVLFRTLVLKMIGNDLANESRIGIVARRW